MRKANVFMWALVTGTAAVSLMGQTKVDLQTQSKGIDFSNAISTKPVKVGTVLPALCGRGEVFFMSNGLPGQNLYGCTSANTWTLESGGGGSGTVTSVFGRTPVVVAGTGDYTAAQVTNAVDSTASYSNPGWITALAATKLTGTVPCAQHPALTGDTTTSAGSCATTVGKLNGIALGGLATGLLKNTTTTGVPSIAVAGTDYVSIGAAATFGAFKYDFSGATHTLPAIVAATSGALPGTCTTGELAFVTGATAGQQLYECSSPNVWTQQLNSGGGSGTVTHTAGALASASLMTGNGSADSQTPCTGCTLDTSGNQVLTGSLITGSGGSNAGTISLSNGTEYGSFSANSFSLEAPTSIATAYRWKVPAADAAGLVSSDGGGTPGTLSIKAIQGTDTKILSAGTITGVAAPLCTDTIGGATTSGCAAVGGYTPLDSSIVQFVDEFYPNSSTQVVGNLPFMVYNITGTGSSSSATIANPVGHPGVYQLKTTAASGDATGLRVGDPANGSDNLFRLGTSGDFTAWEFNMIFRTDTNSVATSGFFVGFAQALTGTYGYGATDGIAVFYDTTLHGCTSGTSSTVNIVYMVRAASSDTCVDSTLAVASSTWYKVRIASTTPGQVIFQVSTNGGAYSAAQTLSTNVPTAILNPTFQVITRQATNHTLDIDRWAINASGVAR